MDDTTRPAATSDDTMYSLTVEDAAERYARAGHPRTLRTIQRYCASGHLDCVKAATTLGDKYFVNPGSVARHITQIEELIPLDTRAASRDLSRQAASSDAAPELNGARAATTTTPTDLSPIVAAQTTTSNNISRETGPDSARQSATPSQELSRQVATDETAPSRLVARLEKEVERLSEDRDFLRDQIKTKDTQIAALLERDHETNILVRGLQQMLSPLLGGPRSQRPEQGREPPSDAPLFG